MDNNDERQKLFKRFSKFHMRMVGYPLTEEVIIGYFVVVAIILFLKFITN